MADDSKPATLPGREQLAAVALDLIARRRDGATICPSEVARAVAGDDEAAWRALMPQVREAAAELADRGLLRVMQRGREVDARRARGAIRLGHVSATRSGQDG